MTCPRYKNPLTVVALTGLAGSGKDTVADALVAHRGFVKLAFADTLRSEISNAFSIDPKHLRQRETKEHPISALSISRCLDLAFVQCMAGVFRAAGLSPELMSVPRSPRQILQWWGTEYRRAQDPDYWTQKADTEMCRLFRAGHTRVVISDCRFPNEADLVRRLMGSIWQVVRPGGASTPSGHVSETEGNQFLPDVLLSNTNDIDYLQLQALAACNRLTLAEASSV